MQLYFSNNSYESTEVKNTNKNIKIFFKLFIARKTLKQLYNLHHASVIKIHVSQLCFVSGKQKPNYFTLMYKNVIY